VLAVLQLTVPKGPVGTVTSAPLERSVPFVVPSIHSTLRLPALSTTTFSNVHELNERDEIGPLTLVPVKGLAVLPSAVEAVHVLANTPLVSCRSAVVPDFSDALIAIDSFFATPATSSRVAEAVDAPANRHGRRHRDQRQLL
jgi:hypothetical protein